MQFIRTTRQCRFVAILGVLLFAALALISAAPHHHGSGATAGTSLPALSSATVGCPLCDWLAQPRLALPALQAVITLIGVMTMAFTALRAALCCSPTPETGSRAPPVPAS